MRSSVDPEERIGNHCINPEREGNCSDEIMNLINSGKKAQRTAQRVGSLGKKKKRGGKLFGLRMDPEPHNPNPNP